MKYFFAFFERSASCSNQNRSRCLFGRCVSSLVGFACLKIPPHSSKGKIEWLIAKNFCVFRRISSLPKSGELCLCRWLVDLFVGSEKNASEKSPLIPSKEDLGRCIGKNFLRFIKIYALPKPRQVLLCRRTRSYMADNKTGASPFVGDAPYLCLMRRNF